MARSLKAASKRNLDFPANFLSLESPSSAHSASNYNKRPPCSSAVHNHVVELISNFLLFIFYLFDLISNEIIELKLQFDDVLRPVINRFILVASVTLLRPHKFYDHSLHLTRCAMRCFSFRVIKLRFMTFGLMAF